MPSQALRLVALACLALLALSALLALPGCGGGGNAAPPAPPPGTALTIREVPPAFSLPDVNGASATFGTDVAPSQWTSYVTPWYFGWAT